ncbi:MAG: ABC transporter ATP-binding protein [Chloroflexota bacterium]|nr:ABC transporter ATP-binding protein [Anaerolineae bacterium]
MSALVEMRGITKIYPNGVLANDRVDFSVESGEIHALVGENGAGKSTLMKLLYGMEALTEGQVFLRGNPVTIRSPLNAISLGIGMVHQSFMLIPSFTIAQNIVLGDEPHSRGFVDEQEALEITQQLAKHYGLEVDAEARVDSVPVGMRQRVEILKALRRGAEVLILDEPTAVLTPQEIKDLFIAIRQLTQEGKTVIFITHKLREVKEVSDRVTVMRQSRVIGTLRTADASEEQIARMMVGREVFMVVDKPPVDRGEVVLEVDDLTYVSEAGNAKLRGVSLKVHSGEILGVAGVEGNGQTELVEVITGLQSASGGSVSVDSKDITNCDTRTVREAGVAHIPEDRMKNGVGISSTLAENLIVDRYYTQPFTKRGTLDRKVIRENGRALIERFSILAPSPEVPMSALSGGNIQKVVVARELSAKPRLLIAAQPTRGIDVGSTEFVHEQLVGERQEGAAILLVSADLAEVMSLSDRIVVMYNGEIVGVFPEASEATEEDLGLYMLGLKRQTAEEMEAYL